MNLEYALILFKDQPFSLNKRRFFGRSLASTSREVSGMARLRLSVQTADRVRFRGRQILLEPAWYRSERRFNR